jgi:hypothetical protein
MGTNTIRGARIIIDDSITPKEMATIRYRKLYEQSIIRNAEKSETTRDYLQELKQFIKEAL